MDVPVPEQTLDGQVALVTGGTRGIGLATAQGLGRCGATVILLGRSGSATVAARLVADGIDAVGIDCDVTDATAVRSLPGRLGRLGRLESVDLLVCSAGVMADRTAKTLRTTDDEWRRVLAVNLDGVFHAVSTFGPGMVERRSGRIIALSACLGRFSGPGTAGGLAPYRIAKSAVNALTKNLAAELGQGRRGVLVDAVCPGHCRTDMGGPEAPRSAEQGADTVIWLATRPGAPTPETGKLWEDRQVIPW